MARFIITRHGETEWNVLCKLQGQSDSALTERGVAQAKQLGKVLYQTPIDRVISSTSPRALITAKHIIGDREVPLTSDPDLREIALGVWEGMDIEAIKSRDLETFCAFWDKPEEYVPISEHAETFSQVGKRALKCLENLAKTHPDETLLIVSHGITIKTLICAIEERPISTLFQDEMIHSTSLTVLEYSSGHWDIHKKMIVVTCTIKHRSFGVV